MRQSRFEQGLAFVAAVLALYFGHQLMQANSTSQGVDRGAIAQLTDFQGSVAFKRTGTFSWHIPRGKMGLAEGDSLRTGENSAADLVIAGHKIHVAPSSLIVIRKPGEKPAVDVVFGQANDWRGRPVAPVISSPKLWWLQPSSETVYIPESASRMDVAWGSQRASQVTVEVLSQGRVLFRTTTAGHEIAVPVSQSGLVTIAVRPAQGGAGLSKIVRVVKLAPPQWASYGVQNGSITLAWKSPVSGVSEVQITDGEKTVWRGTVKETQLSLSSKEISFSSQLIAFVRSVAPSGLKTDWSPPAFIAGVVGTLTAHPDREAAILSPGGEDRFTCRTKVHWITNQTLSEPQVELRDIASSRTYFLSLDQDLSFCPPKPGRYLTVLRDRNKAGVQSQSLSHVLNAMLAAPKFMKNIATASSGGDYSLALKNPVDYPVQIRSAGKTIRLKLPNEPFALKAANFQVRYVTRRGRPMSDWSRKVSLPSVARSVASVSPLDIQTRDTGPVITSDWPKNVWLDLQWAPKPEAAFYELELSSTGRFQGEQMKKTLRANRLFFSVSNSKLWYWRVRAVGRHGDQGPWSVTTLARVQSINPSDAGASIESTPSSNHPEDPVQLGVGQSLQRNWQL